MTVHLSIIVETHVVKMVCEMDDCKLLGETYFLLKIWELEPYFQVIVLVVFNI